MFAKSKNISNYNRTKIYLFEYSLINKYGAFNLSFKNVYINRSLRFHEKQSFIRYEQQL